MPPTNRSLLEALDRATSSGRAPTTTGSIARILDVPDDANLRRQLRNLADNAGDPRAQSFFRNERRRT